MRKAALETKIDKQNEIIITLDSAIYPLEAIYNTAYNFIDRAYLFLDGKGEPIKEVIVTIKPKTTTDKKELLELEQEFLNELLDNVLRYQIAKENKTIREFIVGTALLGSLNKLNPSEEFFTDLESLTVELTSTSQNKEEDGEELFENEEEGENEDVLDENFTFEDPLGIAVPWEEKFQAQDNKDNSKKNNKKKK